MRCTDGVPPISVLVLTKVDGGRSLAKLLAVPVGIDGGGSRYGGGGGSTSTTTITVTTTTTTTVTTTPVTTPTTTPYTAGFKCNYQNFGASSFWVVESQSTDRNICNAQAAAMDDAMGECDGDVPAKSKCISEFDIDDVISVELGTNTAPNDCEAYASEVTARAVAHDVANPFMAHANTGAANAFHAAVAPITCFGDVFIVADDTNAATGVDESTTGCFQTVLMLNNYLEDYINERQNWDGSPGQTNNCDSSQD